jgi:hypothetical protein
MFGPVFYVNRGAKDMRENEILITPLTENQRRVYIDACQIYEAFLLAGEAMQSFKGGMHWKKSKGREYLFRSMDRKGNGKSLGPRSKKTENVLASFRKGKQRASEKFKAIKGRLDEQARFCKAAMIARAPRVVTRISMQLGRCGLLGGGLFLAGTNVLYAYEAAAGVLLDPAILATQDLDIVMDSRGAAFSGDDPEAGPGLVGLLMKVDSSFSVMGRRRFRAVNKAGYMVDLIRPTPAPPWKKMGNRLGGEGDLEAVDIPKLDWLVSSPKLSQIVIGMDGFPAQMVVPDPRAFVIHKLWLSRQKDRNPAKKPRDRAQAVAVARLTKQYLPQYEFATSQLKMFPKSLVKTALKLVDEA